jgi:glyoxylase-like metal-dependent hydrolase (beta-lactamase superfamily II)
MKRIFLTLVLFSFTAITSIAQSALQIEGEEVFKNEDVVFHKLDNHTWVGSGNGRTHESLYLVEGNDRTLLIDAGTNIRDLDKIIGSITGKPVMLVATHVHPDHTGPSIDKFPVLYINADDTVLIPTIMPKYKGEVRFLKEGEIIDLGGRKLEVVFTPGHTPGSTTFLDAKSGYGFSGDSFGGGYLLLGVDFSTLINSCEKAGALMDKYGINFLYNGHFSGKNQETRQRLTDMVTLSKEVLSGKKTGTDNPNGRMGLNLMVNDFGVRILYSAKSLK